MMKLKVISIFSIQFIMYFLVHDKLPYLAYLGIGLTMKLILMFDSKMVLGDKEDIHGTADKITSLSLLMGSIMFSNQLVIGRIGHTYTEVNIILSLWLIFLIMLDDLNTEGIVRRDHVISILISILAIMISILMINFT